MFNLRFASGAHSALALLSFLAIGSRLSGQAAGGLPVWGDGARNQPADENNLAAEPYDPRVGGLRGPVLPNEPVLIRSEAELPQPRLPNGEGASPIPGTVSVERLRHPLSAKGLRMLQKAQGYTHAGDHARAIEELHRALQEPSAMPYAHSILGIEYLKTRQVAAAIAELEEAVQLLPDNAVNHSNLGYALYLSGQRERGEAEIRRAFEVDKNSPQVRFLMGVILLERGSNDQEALAHLEFARRRVPSAHAVLAAFYARHGEKEAAERELRQYPGPVRTTDCLQDGSK
jgi:Tfp pilus assembly protein PilF